MTVAHSEHQTVAIEQPTVRTTLTAVSVVFGMMLMASSYTLEKFGSSALQWGCLFVGCSLLLLPAIAVLFLSRVHWATISWYMVCAGCLEFLNVINLDHPFEFRPLFQRFLCYATAAAGVLYARDQEQMPRTSAFPWPAHLAITAYSCLMAGLWLKDATSAAGVRFVGDSELLTPVGVGYSFGILACVSTSFLLIETRPFLRTLHVISYCCCLLAILSTGSRGSAVFCIILALGGTLLRLRSFSDFIRIVTTLLVIILVLILAVKSNEYANAQLDFVLDRFLLLSAGQVDSSMVIREEIRLNYYRSMDSWILFGLSGYDLTYPHNIFLESILRFGVIGFGLTFAIVFATTRAVINLRTIAPQPLIWVISSAGLFTLLVVQVNLMLEHARFLWLFVGFWCAIKLRKTPRVAILSSHFITNDAARN